MRSTLFFLALIAAVPVIAQTTISGKVVDKESREPLPFATVGIAGKSLHTITNLNGEFDFHLPAEYRNDMFVISMLGYSNFESPVWSLLTGERMTFELRRSTTVLEEVVVNDRLTGGDILRIALSRIPDNYPMQPFLMDGFYRDVKKVAGNTISLLEAAVQIYDENYQEPRNKFRLREHVKLVEVRRSLGYENKFTDYFDQDNLLEDLLLHNNIRYRQIDTRRELFDAITREDDSFYDQHSIFVISIDTNYKLRVFVDKRDYAIIRLEFETKASNEQLQRKRDLVSRFAGIRKVIEFRKSDNKMYLSFMTMTTHINWYDSRSGELKFETELAQQLLINHVEPNSTNRISTTERMRNYGLQYQHNQYNKKFWDDYNVIKLTPLDEAIIKDLEKVAPLEKQFQDN